MLKNIIFTVLAILINVSLTSCSVMKPCLKYNQEMLQDGLAIQADNISIRTIVEDRGVILPGIPHYLKDDIGEAIFDLNITGVNFKDSSQTVKVILIFDAKSDTFETILPLIYGTKRDKNLLIQFKATLYNYQKSSHLHVKTTELLKPSREFWEDNLHLPENYGLPENFYVPLHPRGGFNSEYIFRTLYEGCISIIIYSLPGN